MSDKGTRTHVRAYQDSEDDGSENHQIRVRTVSGKIHGPYTRLEVISFIYSKKLRGEEEVLIGNSTQWRPISSETDFFDALQNVMLGKRAPSLRQQKLVTKVDKSEDEIKTTLSKPKPKHGTQIIPKIHQSSLESTLLGDLDHAIQELPKPSKDHHDSTKRKTSEVSLTPESFSDGTSPLESEGVTRKRKASLALLLVLIVVVFGAIAILPKSNTSSMGTLATPNNFSLPSQRKYLVHLNRALVSLNLTTDQLPDFNQLTLGTADKQLAGWGAHEWTKALIDLEIAAEKTPLYRQNVDYWEIRAWNLRWLGSVLKAADSKQAKALEVYAERIVEGLRKAKKLIGDSEQSFQAQQLFIHEKFKDLAPFSESSSLTANWLAEEAAWLLFWDSQGNNSSLASSTRRYASPTFDVIAKLRNSLAVKPRDVPPLVLQLSSFDPLQYHLWFGFAEYNWRVDSSGIERANRLFQTGLTVAALYPSAVQKVFWKQYGEYLLKFGRQALAEKTQSNTAVIASSDVANGAAAWWDPGSEGLDLRALAEQTFARLKSVRFDYIDLATLQVVSPLVDKGDEYLVVAGRHWAFEKEWERAKTFFQDAIKIQPNSVDGLGGLVWVNASQFYFDEAFKFQDRIVALSSGQEEADKYLAVIHWLGREPMEARKLLSDYVTKQPNDAMAHYFLAKIFEEQQKNNDCLKAANLARMHGQGEIKLRANLLFFRCSIKAGIAITQSLNELKNLSDQEPGNIPILIERIDGLLHANLSSEAMELARTGVERFPWSYALRIKLGEVYESKNDFDRAVAFYNDATVYRKNSAEALVHLAVVLDKQKKFLEAAKNLSVASQVDPGYPDIFLMAGRAFEKAGLLMEAGSYYIREIQERPAALASFLEAAEFLLKNNAPQEVPKIFLMFKSEYQDDPRVQTRMAQAYLALKDYEKARIAANVAIRGDPKIPEPHQILGYVYDENGQFDLARASFERYMQLFPAAPDSVELQSKLSEPPYQ